MKAERKSKFRPNGIFCSTNFRPNLMNMCKKLRGEKDFLFIPLDGKRFKKANYAWTIDKVLRKQSKVFSSTFERSYKSRKLAAQGAERQKNLLAMYEKLAESYAKNLSYDVTHVVVQQNLLPFLWKTGVLGGRTFDVLMTALPMNEIQKRLDLAVFASSGKQDSRRFSRRRKFDRSRNRSTAKC